LKNAKNYFIDAKLYKLTESEIPHHTDGVLKPILASLGLGLEGFRSQSRRFQVSRLCILQRNGL